MSKKVKIVAVITFVQQDFMRDLEEDGLIPRIPSEGSMKPDDLIDLMADFADKVEILAATSA